MDEIVDKLQLLSYEKDFCMQYKLKQLSRTFFKVQAKNQGDQFFYFASLTVWLLRLNGQGFDMPGQFDDPNTALSNIQQGLSAVGVQFDEGISRLRQAYGDAIITLLNQLLNVTLAKKAFAFKPISFESEEVIEEVVQDESELIVSDDIEEAGAPLDFTSSATNKPMFDIRDTRKKQEKSATVDVNQWRLEIERVAPLLKVTLPADNKDWRIHLQQLQYSQKLINAETVNALPKLDAISKLISSTTEKISSREKYINSQFETLCDQFRAAQELQGQKRVALTAISDTVNDLGNELSRVSENLEIAQAQMDDLGSGMSDPKPLVQIKQAKTRLLDEIKDMNTKVALLRHEYFHRQLVLKLETDAQANAVQTKR